MTRQLDDRCADLWLDPDSYRLRNGSEYIDRSTTAIAWEIGQAGAVRGWDVGTGEAERAPARALLSLPAAVDSTRRWVRTPLLRADGMRSLVALEIFESVPTGTSTAYRTWDGTTWRYWTGAAWATATLDAHWSTRAQLEANIATHPVTARRLAIACALATTDADATPVFYGARLGFGARKLSAERDLLLTLATALRAVKCFGAVEWEQHGQSGTRLNSGETSYLWTDADVVIDLDDSEATVAGTFVTGVDATWTPDSNGANGHALRFEGRHSLRIAVHNHRDVSAIEATPTTILALQGDPTAEPPQGYRLIRTTSTSPATARRYEGETRLTATLGLRIVAELQDDLREIATSLRAWLGPARYRALVSEETGAVFDAREITAFRTGNEGLSAGVPESAATWRVTYAAGPLSVSTVTLSGAVTATLEEP